MSYAPFVHVVAALCGVGAVAHALAVAVLTVLLMAFGLPTTLRRHCCTPTFVLVVAALCARALRAVVEVSRPGTWVVVNITMSLLSSRCVVAKARRGVISPRPAVQTRLRTRRRRRVVDGLGR